MITAFLRVLLVAGMLSVCLVMGITPVIHRRKEQAVAEAKQGERDDPE